MKQIQLRGKYEDVEPIARYARRHVRVLGEFTQYSEPGESKHDQDVLKILFISGVSPVNFREPALRKNRGG